ncbi:hypothetical protein KOW79_020427 [Hemibagrus wyckioides]|uniref:Uncharacterized protein n=1 Tax=Hemibagrus wyckioides TaxID=337641 RepID=A0A9D3S8U0_9TELE|nr:hypothetical protein KOW79_020427 [Hemibagrus wyckioides]
MRGREVKTGGEEEKRVEERRREEEEEKRRGVEKGGEEESRRRDEERRRREEVRRIGRYHLPSPASPGPESLPAPHLMFPWFRAVPVSGPRFRFVFLASPLYYSSDFSVSPFSSQFTEDHVRPYCLMTSCCLSVHVHFIPLPHDTQHTLLTALSESSLAESKRTPGAALRPAECQGPRAQGRGSTDMDQDHRNISTASN